MSRQPLSVLISGASVAGPTAAYWLCRQGFAVDATARPHRSALPTVGTERLRLRLFTLPATIARTGRQALLHLADRSAWAQPLADAIHRLRVPAVPG